MIAERIRYGVYNLMLFIARRSRDHCKQLGSERCTGLLIVKMKAEIYGGRVPSKLSAEWYQSERRAIYLQHVLYNGFVERSMALS